MGAGLLAKMLPKWLVHREGSEAGASVVEMTTTKSTELVVVGAGGSGMAAAVAAARNDVKVTIIEKRRTAGGTMNMLAGLVAADSPTQHRAGINLTAGQLFLKHMGFSHWTLNPILVRTWLDRTGETIRWLEDRGVTFQMFSMFTDEPPTSWHWGPSVGREIVKVLLRECQGLGVDFIFETSGRKILLDDAGNVTGLTCTKSGSDMEVRARAVIIATGGYGGNREMVARYRPDYLNPLPVSGIELSHLGEGIRMAFEAGADEEGLGNLLMCGPCFVGGFGVFHLAIEPTTIWVNREGLRFIEEGLGCSPFEVPNAILRQPDQVCFSIFDQATVDRVLKNGYIRPDAALVSPIENIVTALRENIEKEYLKVSESVGDIAAWIGAEPADLIATIERYNQFCDLGRDAEFVKEPDYLKALRHPPYYAAKCYPWHLGSIGGIKINERMEVLDKNRQPIKGLYAVGSDTGGWSSSTYDRYLAGAGASYAVNSGLIGGENVADYVRMKNEIK